MGHRFAGSRLQGKVSLEKVDSVALAVALSGGLHTTQTH